MTNNKAVATENAKRTGNCDVCGKTVKLREGGVLGSTGTVWQYAPHNTPLGGRCIGSTCNADASAKSQGLVQPGVDKYGNETEGA